jgi:hypothetical protein
VNIPFRRLPEHLRAGISILLAFAALFFCGCGASTPAPIVADKPADDSATIPPKPITESEYLRRANGIAIEILSDTSRAAVSCEAVQRVIEKKAKTNPGSLKDVQESHAYQFGVKTGYVTNFNDWFPLMAKSLNWFVRASPPSIPVVSNAMSRVVSEFITLQGAYRADGFDDEWKTNVLKQANIVYLALSSAITSLNLATNIPSAPEECFRTSYRSPHQRRLNSITPTGPAPDDRMMVEHVLRFDWLNGSFHQHVSIDPVERTGNFQLTGPYVMAPLPTVRTNRTTQGTFIYTNLAVVIFRRETNSVLKTLFSDVPGLKDAEFILGGCSLEAKL